MEVPPWRAAAETAARSETRLNRSKNAPLKPISRRHPLPRRRSLASRRRYAAPLPSKASTASAVADFPPTGRNRRLHFFLQFSFPP